MATINSNGYNEIKNCTLIQIIEGLYKSVLHQAPSLRNILNYFFDHCESSKLLLSKRDKRPIKLTGCKDVFFIFIYKAKNHRNYLSHLNMTQNKNVFCKLENIYAYWKLNLSIRIFILERLNIPYEINMVSDYVQKIERWTKEKKLRFRI